MRRSVLGGLTLATALALTACGDDGADPTSSPTGGASSATSTPPATPSPSATAEDTAPSEPTDPSTTAAPGGGDTYAGSTPAAGPEIASVSAAVNAPAGWGEPLVDESGGNTFGPDGDVRYNVALEDSSSPAPRTLDDLVASAEQFGSFDRGRRLDDVVLGGVDAYHYTGIDQNFDNVVDEFGFTTEDRYITLRISTPKGLSQAERDQVVGEVAASFRLL